VLEHNLGYARYKGKNVKLGGGGGGGGGKELPGNREETIES